MKKFLIAALVFAAAQAYGSMVMIVHSSNGSRDVYQLADVQKMAFEAVEMGARGSAAVRLTNSFSVVNESIRLFIGTKTAVSARLFSVNGRVYSTIAEKQYTNGSYLLPLAKNGSLAQGVYVLQVTLAGRIFNQRIVIDR